MNPELRHLAERRRRLVARSATQRSALARDLEALRAPLALADQGLAVLQYIRRHPALIAGAALLLAVLRPRLTGRWLRRGLMLWQVGRTLRSGRR
jgi:hypothetical protein